MRGLFVALYVLYLLNHFAITVKQTISFNKCSDFRNKLDNFDIVPYLGTWYEQYRYFIDPEIGDVCTRVNVTHTYGGSLLYEVTYLNKWIDDFVTIIGRIRFDAPDVEGKFLIDFPARDDFGKSSMKYGILETDYKSYSVAWSCETKKEYNLRNLWVFTRDEFPSKQTLRKINQVLKNIKLPTTFLFKIKHANCNQPQEAIDNEGEYIDP